MKRFLGQITQHISIPLAMENWANSLKNGGLGLRFALKLILCIPFTMLKAAKNMRGKLALLYRVTGRPGHRLHIFLNSAYVRICSAAHIRSDATQTPRPSTASSGPTFRPSRVTAQCIPMWSTKRPAGRAARPPCRKHRAVVLSRDH